MRSAVRQADTQMSPQSGVARALEELQAERQNLSARLEKIDGLIATMRDVFHLPNKTVNAATRPRTLAAVVTASKGAGKNSHRATPSEAAILAALNNGPIAPRALEDRLGVERGTLRYQLRVLQERRLIVCTGTTASRRVALAPAKSAKEEP